MTFATWPLAAVAAAIAVPALIILYFLKLRRRDLEISSTLLWKKAIQDLQANAPFQKLRKNLLLFLQLIVLALALFGLAQPELKTIGLTTERQVILIDRSASMQTIDGGLEKEADPAAKLGGSSSRQTRLEDAKERALALVDTLREPGLFQEHAEEAMVIAFDNSAEVRQAFTSNKAELRAAINAIEPSDAPSSLERAFTLAKAYGGTKKFEDQVREKDEAGRPLGFVPTSPPATIHVFSDGRLPDAESIAKEPQDVVVYHAVGSALAPNIGLTSLRAERAFDNPGKLSIFVGLSNSDRAERRVNVELLMDDQVVKSSELGVPGAVKAISDDSPTPPTSTTTGEATEGGDPETPEEIWKPGTGGTVYVIQRPEGAIARVRISPVEGVDALETDNIGYLVIPPARRLSVCLVTSGNLFIKSVLDGMNLSRFDTKTLSEFQKLWDDDQLAQYDVFIFDRRLPERSGVDGKKTTALPPGRSLVLGAVPGSPNGLIDEGPGEATFFAPGAGARNHPAIQFANIDKVTISKGRKVRINEDAAASGLAVKNLAPTLAGSPGIVEMSDATTLSIIVPFDVADTDWPFDPGWVLFLAGSTQYLSEATIGMANGGGGLRDSVHAGETLSTRLPTGSGSARITLPDDRRIELEPGIDGSVAWGPISQLGIYTVSWVGQATAMDVEVSGRVRRPIAANLLSAEESDIAARAQLALASGSIKAQTQQQVEFTRKLWPWLLLAALGMVMFEWWVYNRKVML